MNRINFALSRQVVSGLAVFMFLAAAVAGNACTFLLPATEGAGAPRLYAFFFAAGLAAGFDFGFENSNQLLQAFLNRKSFKQLLFFINFDA